MKLHEMQRKLVDCYIEEYEIGDYPTLNTLRLGVFSKQQALKLQHINMIKSFTFESCNMQEIIKWYTCILDWCQAKKPDFTPGMFIIKDGDLAYDIQRILWNGLNAYKDVLTIQDQLLDAGLL